MAMTQRPASAQDLVSRDFLQFRQDRWRVFDFLHTFLCIPYRKEANFTQQVLIECSSQPGDINIRRGPYRIPLKVYVSNLLKVTILREQSRPMMLHSELHNHPMKDYRCSESAIFHRRHRRNRRHRYNGTANDAPISDLFSALCSSSSIRGNQG